MAERSKQHGDFAAGERTEPQGPVRDFAEGEEASTVPERRAIFAEGEEQHRPELSDFAEGQEKPAP